MCMTFAKSTNDLHFSDSQLKHDWNYFLTICVKNTNQIKIIKSGTKKKTLNTLKYVTFWIRFGCYSWQVEDIIINPFCFLTSMICTEYDKNVCRFMDEK